PPSNVDMAKTALQVFAGRAAAEIDRLRMQRTALLRQSELSEVLRLGTIGEMANEVAHQLNQPLSAIVNYASGALRRLDRGALSNDDLINVLSEMRDGALRAGQILRRIRTHTRTPGRPLDATFSLFEAVSDIAELFVFEAAERNARLIVEVPEALPKVRGDRRQIEQVLLNLLRNAFDSLDDPAAEEPREVALSARIHITGELEVMVRDTGVGIHEDAAPKVFDAFISTKASRAGLGLAISRTIIESHKGRFWLATAGFDGRGAVFGFYLPAKSLEKFDTGLSQNPL
ncbi:MAG: sensor histidine kinase, partial [Planctomycetia bacterium]